MLKAEAKLAESGLLRNSVIYGSLSLAAYGLSVLKTIVVARWLGTSPEMDAFAVATLIPNLAGALVSSTTASALVPVLIKAAGSGEEARATVFRSALILFTLFCLTVSVFLAFFSEPISHMVAARFDPYRTMMTAKMLRWAAGLVASSGVYAFCSAELLSRKKFYVVGIAPAVSTAVSLAAILLFRGNGVGVLVWSLVAGTTIQALAVAVPAWLAARGGRLFAWRNPHIWDALLSQVPLLGAASIGVANSFVDLFFSARLPAGNVSALNYAATLNSCVMQVIVMPLGWIALPEFSALFAARKTAALRSRIRYCLVLATVIAAPASAAVVLFGHFVVEFILQHGRFHSDSARLVYLGWLGYGLGLVPAAIGMILVRTINAIRQNRLLLYIGLFLLAANASLDYVLMQVWGILGISLSTALVYCVATLILVPVMRRRIGTVLDRRTTRFILLAIAATLLSCAPIVLLGPLFERSPLMVTSQFVLFLTALLGTFSVLKLVRWKQPSNHFSMPISLNFAAEEEL